MGKKLMILAVGLTVGNFVFQAFAGQAWDHATEWSFFQAFALGCAYFWT